MITVWDIGKKPHQYCLARYGDTGPYEIGNCRFITCAENWEEYKNGDHNWWDNLSPEEQERRREKARQVGKAGIKKRWK
jgi:hypothetical protein